jgi:DNA repair exonuclease SbcCD ATPase subunit
MIHFKSCKWKNFLSTGDEFIEVKLDKSPTTLIVGQNGAGKSTLLDALSFGLFGKPHRDIAKIQLVNSINGKKAIVEVEFDIGNAEFKIVRGIKPNKFEIWQNGNMINQASSMRDFQKFLETNILKLNHKSFHQVVVLGSSSFIPFMQLPAWSRRAVIEDLLDIQIFSKMNMLLKERNSKIKDELGDINHQIELYKTKMESQEKYIKDLQSINKDMMEQKRLSIEEHKSEISKLFEDSQTIGKNLTVQLQAEEKSQSTFMDRMSDIKTAQAQNNNKIKSLVKDARFFEDNDNCPTCEQEISVDIKTAKLSDIKKTASDVQNDIQNIQKEVAIAEREGIEIKNKLNELRQRQQRINSNNDKISVIQREVDKVQKEINGLSGQSGDLKGAKKELGQLRESKDLATEKKLEYVEERTYNEVIGEMLKDTGIKTKVIKQYLPVMNRLINNYLQILDFFVAFHLDENFNETIRSRHRDSFNYASFSEGEKQRIDLSLLFTWRQIAKMKNSASTNLLILDETFDSSLDVDGVENLTKILSTLDDDSNVFIISHKGDLLENKFRSKIEFFKHKNFSKIR